MIPRMAAIVLILQPLRLSTPQIPLYYAHLADSFPFGIAQGFGGKGGLANPLAGLADPSVLARVLIRYDRYWPNVQDYEDSFTPAIVQSLANSRIPVLAFSSTNIGQDWAQGVAKSATSTGSRDVTVNILSNWGHLDVIYGTHAANQVFAPTLLWLKRHSQAASDSGG